MIRFLSVILWNVSEKQILHILQYESQVQPLLEWMSKYRIMLSIDSSLNSKGYSRIDVSQLREYIKNPSRLCEFRQSLEYSLEGYSSYFYSFKSCF